MSANRSSGARIGNDLLLGREPPAASWSPAERWSTSEMVGKALSAVQLLARVDENQSW